MIEELGRGGFGIVKKAVRRLLDREEYFAIKILNKMKLKRNRKITVDDEGSILNILRFNLSSKILILFIFYI